MVAVPWRHVESWRCLACGRCCRGYDVVLKLDEWIKLIRTFGMGLTEPRVDQLYLKKRYDGTCIFLNRFLDCYVCGLQTMKPRACKLWPFKIYDKPKHGYPNEAAFKQWGRKFYVYVDSHCLGVRYGNPTPEFTQQTLLEFVEIGLGIREKQRYSTSNIRYSPIYLKLKEKQRFQRPSPLV
jgi:Fe-S-cluster containining protein